jgi:hypothetical protein
MAADALNRLNPISEPGAAYTFGGYPGDLPERIHSRYFTTTKFGAPFAFYTDARAKAPAFRDHGGRLSTDRNDPGVVRDLVAIARHRGWTTIAVRGQTEFRREVWTVARSAGLEVRGYRPTERDRQDLARRTETARAHGSPRRDRPSAVEAPAAPDARAETRTKIIEAVVRSRVTDPSAQARILAAARARIAGWLERGAQRPDLRRGRAAERTR